MSASDSTRPFGVLQYVATGAAADFSTTDSATANPADVLIDVVYTLAAPYRRNARWVMNSNTASKVRKFKDTTGAYMWTDMSDGQQPRLLGLFGGDGRGYAERRRQQPDRGVRRLPGRLCRY
jgi:HK97 family phage major capsid protein